MLNTKLMADLKQAMKDKDTVRKNVITLLRSGLKNESIELKTELTTEQELAVVRRELKQTKDSLIEYEKAGRGDLVANEKAKIAVIETYLPKQLTEDEILAEIQKMGIDKEGHVGKAIGQVVGKLKNVADGALINKVVREYMNS